MSRVKKVVAVLLIVSLVFSTNSMFIFAETSNISTGIVEDDDGEKQTKYVNDGIALNDYGDITPADNDGEGLNTDNKSDDDGEKPSANGDDGTGSDNNVGTSTDSHDDDNGTCNSMGADTYRPIVGGSSASLATDSEAEDDIHIKSGYEEEPEEDKLPDSGFDPNGNDGEDSYSSVGNEEGAAGNDSVGDYQGEKSDNTTGVNSGIDNNNDVGSYNDVGANIISQNVGTNIISQNVGASSASPATESDADSTDGTDETNNNINNDIQAVTSLNENIATDSDLTMLLDLLNNDVGTMSELSDITDTELLGGGHTHKVCGVSGACNHHTEFPGSNDDIYGVNGGISHSVDKLWQPLSNVNDLRDINKSAFLYLTGDITIDTNTTLREGIQIGRAHV